MHLDRYVQRDRNEVIEKNQKGTEVLQETGHRRPFNRVSEVDVVLSIDQIEVSN